MVSLKVGIGRGEGGVGDRQERGDAVMRRGGRIYGYGMYKSIELLMLVGIDIDWRERLRCKSVYLVCSYTVMSLA